MALLAVASGLAAVPLGSIAPAGAAEVVHDDGDEAVAPMFFNWMSWVPDDANLFDLSIPGTHDSGATEDGPSVETQAMSISSQLSSGIRLFDIRLKCDDDDGEDVLQVFHGDFYQSIDFDDVLNDFTSFLGRNPTEALLVRVQEEDGPTTGHDCDASFEEVFVNRYYTNAAWSSYFYDKAGGWPTMEQARKKIVLLPSIFPEAYRYVGFPFGDTGFFDVEDTYEVCSKPIAGCDASMDRKAQLVQDNIRAANGRARGTQPMGITFISGAGLLNPIHVADGILDEEGQNQRLYDFLSRNAFGRLGGVFMDFPGRDLIESVIYHNVFVPQYEGTTTATFYTGLPSGAYNNSFLAIARGTPPTAEIASGLPAGLVAGASPPTSRFATRHLLYVSGTPPVGTEGTHPVAMRLCTTLVTTCVDQPLTIEIVRAVAPSFTSPDTAAICTSTGASCPTRSFDVVVEGAPVPQITVGGFVDPALEIDHEGAGPGRVRISSATPGTYTLLLEATSLAGTASQTLTLEIREPTAPFLRGPETQVVHLGRTAVFEVEPAEGVFPPISSYQWSVETAEGPWTEIEGATGPTLVLADVDLSMHQNRYRVTADNGAGTFTTHGAVLIVRGVSIAADPVDQVVELGGTALFTASATANPTPEIVWETSTDGSTWQPFRESAPASGPMQTLEVVATREVDGHQFRAVYSNEYGDAVTAGATLDVVQAPVVTEHPADARLLPGQPHVLRAAAEGDPEPTVQWQRSADGGQSWTDVPDGTRPELQLVATQADNGSLYRAVFSNEILGQIRTATTSGARLTVDGTPAVATLTSATPANDLGWRTGPVTVTWSCTDPESGVVESLVTTTLARGGRDQIATGVCVNGMGMYTPAELRDVHIDLADPTVTLLSRTPPPAVGGWNNTPVTVTWQCSDRLDPADPTPSRTWQVFRTVETEGADQTATQACVDEAGRTTPVSEGPISIDRTAPVGTLVRRTEPNAAGWSNQPVTVTWSCTDALSGVVDPEVTSTVPTDGADQTASNTCADRAGNTTSVVLGGINVDQAPPEAVLVARTEPNGAGWNNTPVTATWRCTDAVSGAVADHVEASSSTEGIDQSLQAVCADRAGNTTPVVLHGVRIDLSPPVVSGSVPPSPNGWYPGPVTVDWTCSDPGPSGLATGCPDTVITGEGAGLTASMTVEDVAGNRTTVESPPVSIDVTDPEVDLRTPPDGARYLIGDAVEVDFDCSDVPSGIASCVGTQPDGSAIDTSTVGDRAFTATATDLAGNETSRTSTYRVMSRTSLEADPVVTISIDWRTLRIKVGVGARLTTDPGGEPLAGRTVVFSTGTRMLCAAETDEDGIARCNGLAPTVSALLGLRFHAGYAGEDLYLPSSDTASIIGLR